jgi:hypothetical protein
MRNRNERPANPMIRLLPILLLLGAAVFFVASMQRRDGGPRDGRTWRPRARWGKRGVGQRGFAADYGPLDLRAEDLAGLRDAYSGAPLDLTRALVRCAPCGSCYHADSAAVLVRDNAGRCASCGSGDLRPVSVRRD